MDRAPTKNTWRFASSGALITLLCLITAVGTSWATGLVIAEHDEAPCSELTLAKLRGLSRNRDRITTILLGTSRVYYDIDPALLDRVMAEQGQPGFSYDLGAPSQSLLEQLHWLKRIRRKGLPRLQRILIEPSFLHFNWENLLHDRVINVHDVDGMRFVADQLARQSSNRLRTVADGAKHAVAGAGWLLWAGGLGRLVGRLSEDPKNAHGPEWRGNVFIDEEVPMTEAVRARRRETSDAMTRAWAAMTASEEARLPPSELVKQELKALGVLLEQIKALGALPYIFLPVSPVSHESTRGVLLGFGPDAPYVGYRNRDTHPEFFHTELWFDDEHLTRAGAELYTRSLGLELAEHIRNEHEPH